MTICQLRIPPIPCWCISKSMSLTFRATPSPRRPSFTSYRTSRQKSRGPLNSCFFEAPVQDTCCLRMPGRAYNRASWNGGNLQHNGHPGLINPWLINRCPCFSGESSLLEVGTPLLINRFIIPGSTLRGSPFGFKHHPKITFPPAPSTNWGNPNPTKPNHQPGVTGFPFKGCNSLLEVPTRDIGGNPEQG